MIAKQIEIRDNIKKYFDMAYEGEPIIVPRIHNRNVVIISESEYSRLNQANRIASYARSLSERSPDSNSGPAPADSVKTDNLNKLDTIKALKVGWNGNNAPAFPDSLICKVRNIVNNLVIQPEIFPTALCTIQLEYDNSRRDHMEIEIGESDTAEIFISKYNGQESFESIPAEAADINTRIGAFYG